MFEQILDPTGHLWLTVLISLVPLIALLFMLAALRMTAWLATILVGVITIPLGVFVWHAPLAGTLKSYLYGGFTGFWAIDWITFWGLIIFNTLVLTGDFERFKNWMIHHATADIRIQTIMLAWAFGALLEGLVGFGYPWAVVVPILVGLGIADLDAIRVAALANNAPVSYGALGRANSGTRRRDRASADGAFRFHRQRRCGSGAAAALGADLSGERLGRNDRSLAAGDRGLSFLYRRPMARGALPGSVSSGFERSARFLLDSISVRENLAPENDSRIRRRPLAACACISDGEPLWNWPAVRSLSLGSPTSC